MSNWPIWLDEARVMAKSPEKGGETLAQHTWQVLSRLADQKRLRPQLTQIVGEQVWTRLFWACFLHDFGKAAVGFQAMLSSKPHSWRDHGHRHEVLSLGFVDWLFPKGHPEREWVTAAVVSHHRDATDIFFQYGGDVPADETTKILLSDLADQIDDQTRSLLWRWIDECAQGWAVDLSFPELNLSTLVTQEQACSIDLARSTYLALRDFAKWQRNLQNEDVRLSAIIRGLILTADHAASAGAEAFPPMPLTTEVAEKPLIGRTKRDHQRDAQQAAPGSAIMIAPTGSGKTEAALLWAAQQITYRPASRLFYTLPYQASMNAMAERLAERYFDTTLISENNKAVTIQHSRALLKFHQEMMSADQSDPKAANKAAHWLRNLSQLNFYPIQVFSPYQMLKAAYSLKGYETLLLDYTDALFIFDEIHAYEPARMALIVVMIGWLAEHFRARFLIMTATLPPSVREALEQALPDCAEILASPEVFQSSKRHAVRVLDGHMLDQLSLIEQDVNAGKTVLVCCNRIAHAQKVYNELKARLKLSDREIVLLHSRFNGGDRARKEKQLLEAVGVGVENRPRRFVVVATQVVEVSLDIDLDTLFTDPAPLEALLQRFGRVNRGREKQTLCPVHVFREPISDGGDKPYLPYEEDIVNESVRVLAEHCQGQPIDEAQVTALLQEIYDQETISARWWAAYTKSAREFKEVALDVMMPFMSASLETAQKFYKLFDGVEVLPAEYANQYQDAIESEGYLAASRYLVSISWQQYHEFKGYGLMIGREQDEYVDQINAAYDPDFGLDLDGARREARER